MTPEVENNTPRRSKTVPAVATTQFIFIGDRNDGGAGSRAPQVIDNDEEDAFAGIQLYGFKFPKGKPVQVPLDARIADTAILVVNKLRGNSHFFEGSAEELKAAREAREVVVKSAPKKTNVLVKNLGVRGLKQATETADKTSNDGDDD